MFPFCARVLITISFSSLQEQPMVSKPISLPGPDLFRELKISIRESPALTGLWRPDSTTLFQKHTSPGYHLKWEVGLGWYDMEGLTNSKDWWASRRSVPESLAAISRVVIFLEPDRGKKVEHSIFLFLGSAWTDGEWCSESNW
jgi:hypothetical protein